MAVVDRRIGLLFLAFLGLLTIAILRAGYLGVFQSGSLTAAADRQQVQTVPIPALRGEILDRNGEVLAISQSVDEVIANPILIARDGDADTIAGQIAPLLGMPRATVLADLQKPNSGYVPVSRSVPGAVAGRIEALHVNGLSFVSTSERIYPRGTEASQVLGFDYANGNGGAGLEYLFNRALHGASGVRKVINDAQGDAISVTTPKQMQPGKNVQLTLSSPLQQEAQQALDTAANEYHPTRATAIVTDPQTDQVLAVANWPNYNGNAFGTATASQTANWAVDMSYEPGSTFKVVTVGGALADGDVTPSTQIPVPAELNPFPGVTISDAENHGNEELTVANILKVSSNIGADEIANTKLGANALGSWIKKDGFGAATGVALAGEQAGVVPSVHESGATMWNLPFGQGLDVTPMQMVQLYDAIANGGILRTPMTVESVGGRSVREPAGRRIFSTKVAAELRDMLRGVFADGGTASGAQIPGYDLAGKTGTAQDVVGGKYSDTLYTGSFIGMVPASNPKLVVAVVLDDVNQGYGGTVAAPAFQKIVGWAVPYLGINPCPSPCPATAYDSPTTNSL